MRYRILFLALLLSAGCRTYHPVTSPIAVPIEWKERSLETAAFIDKNRFWELFNDPILNALEEEAIRANFDLEIASSRIEKARAFVTKEHAARLPHANLSAIFTDDETLLNPPSFGSPTKRLERVEQPQYSLIMGFTYELDLWGKLKAREEGAHFRWEASQWEYEFIYQTVVADVAIHYILLRTLEEELQFLKRAVAIWKDTVGVNASRVEAGLDPAVDLSRTQLELALAEAELEKTQREYAVEEHALAMILGKPASCWSLPAGHLPEEVPLLPRVLPSEMLARRADIQLQRALVSAGRSDVDAALREYFPSFPLEANLGLASPFMSHFFEWQARYWGYTVRAIEPLFDGGRRRSDVMHAKAQFAENFAFYQRTVAQAFQDVEDALATLHYKRMQYEAQKRAACAAADTFCLAKEQFDSGLISYLLVADSDKTAIEVERKVIFLKGEQILAWIRLIRAFGIQREEHPAPAQENHVIECSLKESAHFQDRIL